MEEDTEEGEVTTVSPATSTSKSLRATIPRGVVRQLRLTEGDKLRWSLRAENSHLVVIVEPIRSKKNGQE